MTSALPPLTAYTALDWLLAIALAVSTLMAFRKGFVRVLFSLAGWVVGFLVASWNYLQFAAWLRQWIGSFTVAEIVAFVFLLAAVNLAFALVASFARSAVAAVGLGLVDRLLGAVAGALRGLLVGIAVLTALVAFTPDAAFLKDSVLAPYFLAGSHGLSFVVPRQLQEQMAEGTAHLLEQTPKH